MMVTMPRMCLALLLMIDWRTMGMWCRARESMQLTFQGVHAIYSQVSLLVPVLGEQQLLTNGILCTWSEPALCKQMLADTAALPQ